MAYGDRYFGPKFFGNRFFGPAAEDGGGGPVGGGVDTAFKRASAIGFETVAAIYLPQGALNDSFERAVALSLYALGSAASPTTGGSQASGFGLGRRRRIAAAIAALGET
jgi:hypothetical protein